MDKANANWSCDEDVLAFEDPMSEAHQILESIINEDVYARKNLTQIKVLKKIIAAAGQKLQLVEVTYKKQSTGEVKTYLVEPYSFRLIGKKEQIEAFYGYDIKGDKIIPFIIDNIKSVSPTTDVYTPRWEVEF